VAAGYTGRDQAGVLAHVEELRKIGVPAPEKVPSMYWVEPERVSNTGLLWVVGESTSGEGEVFLARDEGNNLCVTVASDHTDRALETVSVAKAKQACSKVIGSFFWRVDEVRGHWDSIDLRTWNDGKLYQEGTLGKMLPPEKLFELAREDAPAGTGKLALFSGTLPGARRGERLRDALCSLPEGSRSWKGDPARVFRAGPSRPKLRRWFREASRRRAAA
jgi:hypothetical protein